MTALYTGQKSLYVLRRSPQPYYHKQEQTSEGFEFKQHPTGENEFKISIEGFLVVILVYVDYLMTQCSKEDALKWVMDMLCFFYTGNPGKKINTLE